MAVDLLLSLMDPVVTTRSGWMETESVPVNQLEFYKRACHDHGVVRVQHTLTSGRANTRVSADRMDKVRGLLVEAADYSYREDKVAGVVRTSVARLCELYEERFGASASNTSIEQALVGLRRSGWLIQLSPGRIGQAANHVLAVPVTVLPAGDASSVLVNPDELRRRYFASRRLTAVPHASSHEGLPTSREGSSCPPDPSGDHSPPPPRPPSRRAAKQPGLMNPLDGGRTKTSLPQPPPPTQPDPPAPGPGRPEAQDQSGSAGQPVRLRIGEVTVVILARAGDTVTLDPHAVDGPTLAVHPGTTAPLDLGARPSSSAEGPANRPVEQPAVKSVATQPQPDQRIVGLLKAALTARATNGTDRARPRDLTALAMRIAKLESASCLTPLLDRHGEAALSEALTDLYADMGAATGNWDNLAITHFNNQVDTLPVRTESAQTRLAAATAVQEAELTREASHAEVRARIDSGWAALDGHERDELMAEAEAQTRANLHLGKDADLSIGARHAVEGLARELFAERFVATEVPPDVIQSAPPSAATA
ncbi:hypothetical protein [Euzebya pacifica]|uniref:hypothetical protein n=1 Tax=Euzebya pacifica TaxID=1608957 RepID=UPI000DF7CD5B|nr:hypothetical protein [Euzebya pacifica]